MIRSTLFLASLVGVAAAPIAHAQPSPAQRDEDPARKPAAAARKPTQKDIDAARLVDAAPVGCTHDAHCQTAPSGYTAGTCNLETHECTSRRSTARDRTTSAIKVCATPRAASA